MGTKITNLPQVTVPNGADEFPVSQDTGSGTRTTYKTTLDQISNYVKSAGGGTGTVTSVGVASPNGSLDVFGSPIVGSGTINLDVKSVGLNKLANGGAINGHVLTYNGTAWVASAVPTELPSGTNGQVLAHNGTTWVASAVPTELPSGTNGQVLAHNGTTWVASDPVSSEPYSAKAFGSIRYANGNTSGNNETGGVGSQASEVVASSFYNVVSVTWMERGIYRVTFTTAMPNINYSVVAQNAPVNGFTFASNGDENFMDYSSPDYYHNGNENSLFIFNKTTASFEVVSWSQEGNRKENMNGFDFVVFSV